MFLGLVYLVLVLIVCTEEATSKWKSKGYDHYMIALKREYKANGDPHRLCFVFTCCCDPKGHRSQTRPHMNTSWGTSNLLRESRKCVKARGIRDDSDTSAGAQQTLGNMISKYSEYRHRALITLRRAKSRRPFNSVLDPEYRKEVELLHPGTKLPSPLTVSRDLGAIYTGASNMVKAYFAVRVSHTSLDQY